MVSVKVIVVVPFNVTLEAPKDFAMVGGATTVRLADAVNPVPPSVEVIAAVVFV